jgi:Protein of unknown function (DUF2959)
MSKLSLVVATLLALATFPMIGCGNGQDRSEKTARTSALVSVDVTTAKQNLDQVVAGLKNVRDASDSADLKKLYGDLQGPTSTLKDSLATVQATSERAIAAGKAQNDEWHKQADTFTDPDLRNSSSKRQNDLRGTVDALVVSNTTLKSVSDPYLAQLEQSLKALDLDLTQQGLQAIKPSVNRLIDEEAKLRDALNDVATKGKAVNGVINP